MLLHLYDVFVFVLALGIPAIMIFQIGIAWLSLPLAATATWLVIYFGGRILTTAHSAGRTAELDAIWLRTGWIAGLIYAFLLFGLRAIIRYARRTRKA